jgi:tetratricopeptide (TPR) repeat protein
MNKDNPGRPKPSFRKKTILIISGIFLFFILLEIGLRLEGFIFLSLQKQRNTLSIKQKGTYRIMCLGESTTALGGRDSYPFQLGEVLNQENTGIKFSVINEGIPGIDTQYILARLEDNLNKYKPDMVITMMGAGDGEVRVLSEGTLVSKFEIFLANFKIYKLTEQLRLHIATKAKEAKIYNQKENKKMFIAQLNSPAAKIKSIPSEEELKINLKLNPREDNACVELGKIYIRQWKWPQAEELFKKALELNSRNDGAYVGLGEGYLHQRKFTQSEDSFKKALELNRHNEHIYTELSWCYKRQGKFSQAEDLLKRAINLNPKNDLAYGGLATLYERMGRSKLAKEYYKKANELRLEYYNPITRSNYQKLKEILDKRGIRLVCVQYPVRSIEPLKKIFEDQAGVIFVDNERIFREAVKKEGYKEYFTDMIAGDFGHFTLKCNRLLAENIANVILKECFNR